MVGNNPEQTKESACKKEHDLAKCRGPAPADPGYSKRGRRRRPI